ncbi:hypothetical protein Forpe1208_v011798 [Fusarium oxysporum f. sp. rapae]|uniref:Uncharacterized protein n=1 Tax=Fusarium oxysporum f. sp. rapae TaxID=485398 RepID=A0A8J5TSW8_FUSOX|nr:hypothetical protein Forpe1208_v011798 [Fusarium oxysporum f. sp. rapae]
MKFSLVLLSLAAAAHAVPGVMQVESDEGLGIAKRAEGPSPGGPGHKGAGKRAEGPSPKGPGHPGPGKRA